MRVGDVMACWTWLSGGPSHGEAVGELFWTVPPHGELVRTGPLALGWLDVALGAGSGWGWVGSGSDSVGVADCGGY